MSAPPPAPDPAGVGIGLRAPHYAQILEDRPALAFVEVHSENFFAEGGAALDWLERFRAIYPLSLHGVGLSLGSADPIDERHLGKLARLVERFEPALVSEHLCWSSVGGRHANDLLPLPYTPEALDHVVSRIEAVQERLGRAILVENVSSYVAFDESSLPEWEFLAQVARRSGCSVLLDVNNIWVSACNHGFDAARYLGGIEAASVAQIHLAGHERVGGRLVDTHGARVSEDVWALYAAAIARFGPRPTLVEWDVDIPALDVLLGEAARAAAHLAPAARRSTLEMA
ncbi:MAG: MNIO family bufferin maturase [Usitatibacter sp.]